MNNNDFNVKSPSLPCFLKPNYHYQDISILDVQA